MAELKARGFLGNNGDGDGSASDRPPGVPATWDKGDRIYRQSWGYCDVAGRVIGYTVRYEAPSNTSDKAVIPFFKRDGERWRAGQVDGKRLLYDLHRLLPADGPTWICEGEKSAEALKALGATATTSPGGSKAANKADWTALDGKTAVVIWRDNDDAGQRYQDDVISELRALPHPPKIRVVDVSKLGLPEKADCVDWKRAHPDGRIEDLPLVDAGAVEPKPDNATSEPDQSEGKAFFRGLPYWLSLDFGTPAWTVRGILPAIGCGFLTGQPKGHKTWTVLDLCLAVATGRPFLGIPTVQGRVMYLGAEGGAPALLQRVRMLCAGRNLTPDEIGDNLYLAIGPKIQIDTGDGLENLAQNISTIKPTLLVLDPFSRLHSQQENDRSAVEPILTRLRQLSEENGCMLMLIHHSAKPGKDGSGDPLRGSSAFRAWHDALWIITAEDADRRKLTFELRDGEAPEPITFRLKASEILKEAVLTVEQWTPTASQPDPTLRLLEALEQNPGGSTLSDLAEAMHLSKTRTKTMLKELAGAGRARPGQGKARDKSGREYTRELWLSASKELLP